ncbi:unnamed protein product, partial [Adineta ricciae]
MGCGSSLSVHKNKIVDSTATSNTSIFKSSKLPSINKSAEKREENLEPFTLACLGKHFDENDPDFRSVINYICCFNDSDQCEEFLKDSNRKTGIFFIVSYQYLTNLISHIHELPQILAIYIHQDDKSKHIDKHWTKRYAKIKGVYSDRESLLEELSSDVKISLNIHDLVPISVYSRIDAIQTSNNSTDHLRFLFYQLFIQQYCLNSSKTLTNHDFLKFAQKYYQANRKESKLIKQFINECHSSKDLFFWFLQNSFLRRMFTQSLLTLDIQLLFFLRYFIHDMHRYMVEQATNSSQRSNYGAARFNSARSTSEKVFYRGQALGKDTFLKIKSNIGEMLSMNNFVLASKNRQDCLANLRQNVSTTNLIVRVLFEIKAPWEYSQQKQRPFIDLDQSSSDDDIYSTVFFIGSIFRINTVEFDINNDCWNIQLTLYDEKNNQDFSQVFTFLNNFKSVNTQNATTSANLLRQISPNSAEQLYKYLLKENDESLSKIECYRGLGLCSYANNDYGQALSYFEKALQYKPTDKFTKSTLHNSIGLVYARQNQNEQALNHFNKALEYTSLPLHSACIHHNLALIYSQQEQYEEELEHYEQALKLRTQQLPSQHLQLASLHNNIGIAYSDMHDYDNSLSNLKTALEIRLKLLSDSHIDVARSYANIGTVYSKTQEFRMALDYFTKAHLLLEKQTQLPEQDIEQLKKNIKIVNDKLR